MCASKWRGRALAIFSMLIACLFVFSPRNTPNAPPIQIKEILTKLTQFEGKSKKEKQQGEGSIKEKNNFEVLLFIYFLAQHTLQCT
jgi:hypothetical protein